MQALIKKIKQLFAKYPNEAGVNPDSFKNLIGRSKLGAGKHRLAIQSVPDKLYFLLFGAIRARMLTHGAIEADLIVVRAVSGTVGTGWIAELKRSAPIVWLWSKPWHRAYGSLISGVAFRCATWRHPLYDLADWFKSKAIWQKLIHQESEPSLMIDGIEVADLLIDSYLRFKPSPRFDSKDPFVRRLIWQAMRDVRQAFFYFKNAKPRWYITSYTTYLEHGISARVAVHCGVDVWSFGNLNQFGKKLSAQDTFHTSYFSNYKSDFENLSGQEIKLAAAKNQLEMRLSGGIDTATSYMRESAYANKSVPLPNGLNGSAIVFLHDFYDSPHVYDDLVFQDFWSWICFTIETLQSAGIHFFIKPHPNQISLSDAAIAQLQTQYPSLNWLPTGVSNAQLVMAGIACGVTVYGTVAHELAYLGVPSIACARHPHHSFDFCRTAHDRSEYAQLLKTHTELPIPFAEMRDQALAFYYMHNLSGNSYELELKRAFVALWTTCNMVASTEELILDKFYKLITLEGFNQFIESMQINE